MISQRIPIDRLVKFEESQSGCQIAGRLVQLSPATISLEDETDRRTFGFPNQNPDVSRVRLGDIVEANVIFREKSWRVEDLKVLVPCTLTGHAFKKWMKRWMMHGDRKRKNLVLRHLAFKAARKFFDEHDFMEVQTPLLVSCPGMEPTLNGFRSEWEGPEGAWKKEYFLPTSPEFHLKKMLTLGYERIFEFSRSFRNCEYSNTHQPEFTMLEWYRAYDGYERIMEDIENLVSFVANDVLDNGEFSFRGSRVRLSPPWIRMSVRDMFLNNFGIDLSETKNPSDLARLARNQGYDYIKSTESFDDVFFKLFLTEVELKLGWERPVILYDYPIEMAALSRRKPGSPRYCERFEVYICGVELANAFGELNNAREQTKRFNEFSEQSDAARGFHYEADSEFLDALGFGMPPSAGIALGFDRLIMLLANETSLDPILSFPHLAPYEEDME